METPQERELHAQALSRQLIGHYRVARHLGSGAMGAVFLAEDTKLERAPPLKAGGRKRFLALRSQCLN
jgi:hypothetical protein